MEPPKQVSQNAEPVPHCDRATKKNFKIFHKGGNFLSNITFAYALPTFFRGYARDFEEEDFTETLDEYKSKKLGDALEKRWLKEKVTHTQSALARAIVGVFSIEFIALGFLFFFTEACRITQPLALSFIIKHYMQPNEEISIDYIYYCCGLLVGATLLNGVIRQLYLKSISLFGMKVRVACSSLVYRKCLKLSKAAFGQAPVGQVINLLSNDISRIDTAVLYVHAVWLGPLEVLIVTLLMYNLIGLMSTVGIILMLILIVVQVYCSRRVSQSRSKVAVKTDERIHLMNEIISGMQVIKMYTWEKPFTLLVEAARRLELQEISSLFNIQAFLASARFAPKIGIFVSIAVYTLTGNIPNALYIFTITPFYNILRDAIFHQLQGGITDGAELWVSLKRIQNFLLYDEIKDNGTHYIHTIRPIKTPGTEVVTLHNVSAANHENSTQTLLHDINLVACSDQLVSIIGSVGCGKTSILNVILNELNIRSGTVYVYGKVSYAPQEPWIFAGSIRENILLRGDLDMERYNNVIKVCCLERDIDLLPYGDSTIVGERGVTLSGGQKARVSLARAVYSRADIYLLDDPLSAVDAYVGKRLFERCIQNFLNNKCVILVTHQLQYLHNADQIYLLENGTIALSGSFQTIKESSLTFANYLTDTSNASEENGIALEKIEEASETVMVNGIQTQTLEQRGSGRISPKLYYLYFNAFKSVKWLAFVSITLVGTQIAASGLDFFTSIWANLEQDQNFGVLGSRTTCLYIYTGVTLCLITILFLRSRIFFEHCLHISAKVHSDMLSAIISSPMKFFDNNSSGRILNRFSKDLGVVDETIPKLALTTLEIGLTITGIVVIIAYVNLWMLLAVGLMLSIFYVIRLLYLPTNTSIKRLEAIRRSPIFAHINESLQGLTTIRAFMVQTTLEKHFYDLLDLHSSAFSHHIVCARAYCYYIEFVCVIYTIVVIITVLFYQQYQYGGTIGLAISQALSMSGILQFGMRSWTELESQMTSFERLLEYTKIEQEKVLNSEEPPLNWPKNGEILFRSVSLKYPSTDHYALQDINFHINPCEKIGIVGRTGAGKSSLISALFQLTPTEGEILIDGVNIAKITHSSLRSKMAIIPQQPVLFSGTLRRNLDPFNQFTDEELWSVLQDVKLKSLVAKLPLGLNNIVNEGGSNFSVGQKQLICLARAILCNTKILVLDEATANIDLHSDSIIQNTIKKKFNDSTVLTVAHRLTTVIRSDRIIVVDAGKIVEFDQPHELLMNTEGVFYTMMQQLGTEALGSLLENMDRMSPYSKLTKFATDASNFA